MAQALGGEHDVARLVHAVDVPEGGRDREHGPDRGEGLVHGEHLLGGRVQLLGVDVLVVDPVLLAAGDPDLHLEPDLHGGHALEVLEADGNVILVGLLRQVEHVRPIEGLAVLVEELLVGGQHSVEPRKQLQTSGGIRQVDSFGIE
jgi:hypothetical protein